MQFLRNFLRLGKASTPTQSPVSPPVTAPSRPRLKVGWATDVGEERRNNEDAAVIITAAQEGDNVLSTFGLLILADGMGGHQAGEVASSLAAQAVAHHIMHQFYLPSLISQEHDTDQPALNELLVDAVQAANTTVADRVPGGGTTLTCALMFGPRVYIAHVGDSRAYIVTEQGMSKITHDHSLVDRLVESGQLTRDEAATHPQKNVLYRAVGQGDGLEVDIYARTIPHGGRLMLCSDGLWSIVSDAEMTDIAMNSSCLQLACEHLIDAANRVGGCDNITVILVEPPVSQSLE